MRILEDHETPYGCEYCLEAFYLKAECREHEGACPERDMTISGFQIEEVEDVEELS